MPDYVSEYLMAELPSGGTLTCAAIFGLEGDLWQQSADFPELQSHEIQSIIRALDEPITVAATGINLANLKFMLIPSEAGEVLRGRSKNKSLIVRKTHKAMIIGVSQEPVPLGEASVRIEDVSRYLKDDGF